MNASTGDRTQPPAHVTGIAGLLTGCSDHQSRPARRLVVTWYGSIGSVPQLAPLAIHSRSEAFSLAGSGALGGISSDSTRSQSGLSSSLPATIAGPLSPRIAPARLDRSSFPLGSTRNDSRGAAGRGSAQRSSRSRISPLKAVGRRLQAARRRQQTSHGEDDRAFHEAAPKSGLTDCKSIMGATRGSILVEFLGWVKPRMSAGPDSPHRSVWGLRSTAAIAREQGARGFPVVDVGIRSIFANLGLQPDSPPACSPSLR